jgi:hypothetical protein
VVTGRAICRNPYLTNKIDQDLFFTDAENYRNSLVYPDIVPGRRQGAAAAEVSD